MNKQFWINLAKYGVGFGLLALVIWQHWAPTEDSPGLAKLLSQQVQYGPLTLAILIALFSLGLTLIRWYILVRAQDLPFGRVDAVRLGLVGYFFSNVLPAGSVGGDIIKAIFIAREQSRRTVAVATIIIDRAVGLWALFWVVALLGSAFWLAGETAIRTKLILQVVLLGAIGLVVFTSILWFILNILPAHRAERFAGRLQRLPRVGTAAAEFWRAIWMYRCKSRSIAIAFLLSLVGHCGFVLTFYYCALTFQDPATLSEQVPSLAEHFLLVPVGLTIQALVPLPGGMGVSELGFGGLYFLLGKPYANGVVASLTQRMITWGLSLIGYVIYLQMRPQILALKVKPDSNEERHPAEEPDDLAAPTPAAVGAIGPDAASP